MKAKYKIKSKKKAVVLLSGGLDSAVALSIAKDKGFVCYCLIFDYGQRHRKEIEFAKKTAITNECDYKILKIDFPWKGSSLLDEKMDIVKVARSQGHKVNGKIPNTYVPGRNIIFLSYALSYAEAIGANEIFIGAHAQDYSGYPDCRPEFFEAFNGVVSTGTKAGLGGSGIKISAPLISKGKSDIIDIGQKLGVDFSSTWSCYQGDDEPCGECDSCYYREKGFSSLGLTDPLLKEASKWLK